MAAVVRKVNVKVTLFLCSVSKIMGSCCSNGLFRCREHALLQGRVKPTRLTHALLRFYIKIFGKLLEKLLLYDVKEILNRVLMEFYNKE